MKRLLGALGALAVLAVGLAWLAGMFAEKIPPGTVTPAATVARGATAVVLEPVRVPVVEQAVGTVRARDEALIATRISATVASVSVRAGDAVSTGEPLVRLDARELEARLAQAREAVVAARAALGAAEPDYQRLRALFDRGAVSRADLERSDAAVRSARAELARAERAVDEAEIALGHTELAAPFAGRVIERYVEPGDTVIVGAPLVRLYDPARLRLEAAVRESIATRLARGDALQARIDALDRTVAVAVEEIVPSADPASRTFVVKARLPDDASLYPGMFARLLIPLGEREALYLPRAAVARVGQLEYVEIPTDTGPRRRFVRIGAAAEGAPERLEVLSGLTAGESILVPASVN